MLFRIPYSGLFLREKISWFLQVGFNSFQRKLFCLWPHKHEDQAICENFCHKMWYHSALQNIFCCLLYFYSISLFLNCLFPFLFIFNKMLIFILVGHQMLTKVAGIKFSWLTSSLWNFIHVGKTNSLLWQSISKYCWISFDLKFHLSCVSSSICGTSWLSLSTTVASW